MAQIPGLVEKSEPQIENALRSAIQKMSGHPDEARIFQTNWKKLNSVVDSELSKIVSPPPTDVGGRKRKSSKRTKRSIKK